LCGAEGSRQLTPKHKLHGKTPASPAGDAAFGFLASAFIFHKANSAKLLVDSRLRPAALVFWQKWFNAKLMPEAPEAPATFPPGDVSALPTRECPTPETAPILETTNEPNDMLDVHPAHHAANSWKEFFVHIATIVLGLLIAIGLEQTVEYIRHSHELSAARREIAEEKRSNIENFRRSTASFQAGGLYLKAYLATLRQAIKDTAAPLQPMYVPLDFVYSQYTAWTTAEREGAVALMPSGEQSANDRMYVGLHTLDQIEDRAYTSTAHAESLFLSGLDPDELTLEQKRQLYRDASDALVDITYALVVQRVTMHFSPEFGDEHSLDPSLGAFSKP